MRNWRGIEVLFRQRLYRKVRGLNFPLGRKTLSQEFLILGTPINQTPRSLIKNHKRDIPISPCPPYIFTCWTCSGAFALAQSIYDTFDQSPIQLQAVATTSTAPRFRWLGISKFCAPGKTGKNVVLEPVSKPYRIIEYVANE